MADTTQPLVQILRDRHAELERQIGELLLQTNALKSEAKDLDSLLTRYRAQPKEAAASTSVLEQSLLSRRTELEKKYNPLSENIGALKSEQTDIKKLLERYGEEQRVSDPHVEHKGQAKSKDQGDTNADRRTETLEGDARPEIPTIRNKTVAKRAVDVVDLGSDYGDDIVPNRGLPNPEHFFPWLAKAARPQELQPTKIPDLPPLPLGQEYQLTAARPAGFAPVENTNTRPAPRQHESTQFAPRQGPPKSNEHVGSAPPPKRIKLLPPAPPALVQTAIPEIVPPQDTKGLPAQLSEFEDPTHHITQETATASPDFPSIVKVNGRWVEVICRSCYTNMRSDGGFMVGLAGVKCHYKRCHAEPDGEHLSVWICHKERPVSADDFVAIRTGRQPSVGIVPRPRMDDIEKGFAQWEARARLNNGPKWAPAVALNPTD